MAHLSKKLQILCTASHGDVVALCDWTTYMEILRWRALPRSVRETLPYPYPVFTFSDTKKGVTGTRAQLRELLKGRKLMEVEMYVPHANGTPFGSFGERHPTFWDIWMVLGQVGLEVFYGKDITFDTMEDEEGASAEPHAAAS